MNTAEQEVEKAGSGIRYRNRANIVIAPVSQAAGVKRKRFAKTNEKDDEKDDEGEEEREEEREEEKDDEGEEKGKEDGGEEGGEAEDEKEEDEDALSPEFKLDSIFAKAHCKELNCPTGRILLHEKFQI